MIALPLPHYRAMKQGMSKTTGKQISGIQYLEQRFADALSTSVGTLVVDRAYGANLDDLVDANIDDDFRMRAFSRVASALRNPLCGLDDIALQEIEMQQPEQNTVLVIARCKWQGSDVSLAAPLQVAA